MELTALSSRRLGSICRQGDRIWKVQGKMLSSPCLDLPGCPTTPTMSPLLQLLCRAWNASKSSSDLLHSNADVTTGQLTGQSCTFCRLRVWRCPFLALVPFLMKEHQSGSYDRQLDGHPPSLTTAAVQGSEGCLKDNPGISKSCR